MATDLTSEAAEGFDTDLGQRTAEQACPYFASSPAGMGWLAGAWLKSRGHGRPTLVRMSRGYTVRADGMLLSLETPGAIERVK